MPQAGTVTVRGLRETLVALNKIQRGAHRQVLGGLLKAGEPVRETWVGKLSRYQGVQTASIAPKMTTRSVIVRQNARKVTGRRSDFGSIQMRLGLEALFERADDTTKIVEHELDVLTLGAGF